MDYKILWYLFIYKEKLIRIYGRWVGNLIGMIYVGIII